MNITAVIPARLGSTRFPRKILADIQGKPMLWHVWSRVMQAKRISQVYVATDSEEITAIVHQWGGKALLTSAACTSGTDRIASLLPAIQADYFINIQGDEPLIDPDLVDELAACCQTKEPDLATAAYRVSQMEDLTNSSIVKIVRDLDGNAIYFSRQAIPFVRDHPIDVWMDFAEYWGHIGIYAYQRDVLRRFPTIGETQLEKAEKLEQLRFVEAGYRFCVVETDYRPYAVDYPHDIDLVLRHFPQK